MALLFHKHPVTGLYLGQEHASEFPAGDGDDCGSAIVISHGVQIAKEYQGQGFGKALHAERLARFAREGYNYALCTVRRDNDVQCNILRKAGWNRLANSASYTGTPIYLMGRSLK